MLRIAIVDPSDYSRDPLRSLLLGVDFVWLESECSRYEFFPDVVSQSPPDLAIVVLDSDHQRALNMISQVAAAFPKLPILTISSDHQALLQSLQRGARYFLTQPVGLEEMLATLRRAQMENGLAGANGTVSGPAGHSCQVVAILGSRGGVGCTSLAVNLGCDLASDPANSVVLLDLDMALGDADISLDLMPDHTLADLAINIERLDMNFLKRSMMRHESTGLYVLTHPLQIADVGVIHEDHVARIINLLKISHTHLILDLSKALIPTDMTALRLADHILLLAQLELGSLRNVVRILMALGDDDGLNQKVRIVMNRVGSDYGEGEISLKKAEETIGRPIFWQIPNDTKAMVGSRVAGVPLIQYAPKSRAHQAIYALAQTMSNKPEDPAVSPRPTSSSFFKRLVGR
ncbi:MAG: pilus assembly protein CpaE [Gemmataceae bacterium]|nr:pilus assembly protein CpaE [Gemmataceae bacterium]